MKQKLLNNTEGIAIFFMGFLALVMGGWNTSILAVLAGVLIGLSAHHDRAGVIRAGVIGAIAGLFIFVGGYIFNNYVIHLPGVDEQAKDQITIMPLIVAVIVSIATSAIVAAINAIHDETKRKQALMLFMVVCAVVFPFFDQCPTLSWTDGFSFTNPTHGCSTEKPLIWINAVIVTMIYALQALGLNIVAGYAGLLDLGYVAFFAIGAYTMGLLNSDHLISQGSLGGESGLWNQAIIMKTQSTFWLVVWVCAAMAALFGFLLGSPTLPLRGDYLAIVTLGFGEIIPIAAKNLEQVRIFEPITLFFSQLFAPSTITVIDRVGEPAYFLQNSICFIGCDPARAFNLTNGTKGISPIFAPSLLGYTFKVGEYIPWYFLALVLLAASAFFIQRVRDSRIGRAWVSMREDELAANAMGVNLIRTKLLAFLIGALFSGFAGAFYGSYVSFIEPGSFAFDISVTVLAMVILGGMGNFAGVILGAFIIRLLDLVVLEKIKQLVNGFNQQVFFSNIDNQPLLAFINSLTDATAYKIMIFGLILVIMMKVRPQGLLPQVTAANKRKSS